MTAIVLMYITYFPVLGAGLAIDMAIFALILVWNRNFTVKFVYFTVRPGTAAP
jgi:hypothetical protein